MPEVVSINITSVGAGKMHSVAEIRALVGKGLEGDRYSEGTGTYSKKLGPDREVTLIEAEAIDALARECGIEIDAGSARRNIVTRGVPLNHLVGKKFRVGEVVLEGIRLCEPCGHMESLTKPGVKDGLIHRGGLRARVIEEGIIRAGDRVEVEG